MLIRWIRDHLEASSILVGSSLWTASNFNWKACFSDDLLFNQSREICTSGTTSVSNFAKPLSKSYEQSIFTSLFIPPHPAEQKNRGTKNPRPKFPYYKVLQPRPNNRLDRTCPLCRFDLGRRGNEAASASSLKGFLPIIYGSETWLHPVHPRNWTVRPWKMMLGRWSFPFGALPIFRGELLNIWGVVVKYSHFPSSMIMGERVSILTPILRIQTLLHRLKNPSNWRVQWSSKGVGYMCSLETYLIYTFFLILICRVNDVNMFWLAYWKKVVVMSMLCINVSLGAKHAIEGMKLHAFHTWNDGFGIFEGWGRFISWNIL